MLEVSERGAIHPSPGRAWAVVALCFTMLTISAGTVFYGYGVFVSEFADAFNASAALTSLPLTIALVVSGAAAAPVGWLSEKVALRWLALFGVVATALGMALVSVSQNMTQIIIIYTVLIGMGDVLLGMMMINLITVRWFERRRGMVIGMAATGASFAIIIFPPITQYLNDMLGWRQTFIVFSLVILALAPPIYWLMRAPIGGVPNWEVRSLPNGATATAVARIPAGALLRDRNFWLIVIGVGVLKIYNSGVMGAVIPFIVHAGVDKPTAAKIVSLIGAVALLSKLLCGALLDHFDSRWILRMALTAGAAAMMVLSFGENLNAFLGAALLYGVSLGAMLPLWGSMTAQYYPAPNYGRALGLTRAAMTPTNVAPVVLGLLYDVTGDYRTGWLALAAMAGIGLGTSLLVQAKQRPNWKGEQATD